MDLATRLKTLREATAGCSLVAFGDLGSRLVLRSSAETQPPQEYLDQLCAQADRGFCMQDALLARDAMSDHRQPKVMIVTPLETRIYIRAAAATQDTASDAILCVCDSELTAQKLVGPAAHLLHDLSGGA